MGRPCPSQLALGVDSSLDPSLTCRYCKDTGHLKENCVKLTQCLAWDKQEPKNETTKDNPPKNSLKKGKLKAPSAKDQAAGDNDHGPHNTDYEKELIWSIHSSSILAGTKLEIMQHAVARSPKVCISAHGIQIPSLLDSGSDVTLLRQAYF